MGKLIFLPEAPESLEVQRCLVNSRNLQFWGPVEDAKKKAMLRQKIRHVEILPKVESIRNSPIKNILSIEKSEFALNVKQKDSISLLDWYLIIDKLLEMGVEYFLFKGFSLEMNQLTHSLMRRLLNLNGSHDLGWYTDGIFLQNKKNGNGVCVFSKLVNECGILEFTTHIPVNYYSNESVLQDETTEQKILATNNFVQSSIKANQLRSFYGMKFAKMLIEHNAKRVVITTTISNQNINQVFLVYNFVCELQNYATQIGSNTVILWTCCPYVWRPFLARGDDVLKYPKEFRLEANNIVDLRSIFSEILNNTYHRILLQQSRVAGNSSAFLRGFSEFSTHQCIPYEKGPDVLCVKPNGTVNIDPIFSTVDSLRIARNPHEYRDREVYYNPFHIWDTENSNERFPNLIQSTRSNELKWK